MSRRLFILLGLGGLSSCSTSTATKAEENVESTAAAIVVAVSDPPIATQWAAGNFDGDAFEEVALLNQDIDGYTLSTWNVPQPPAGYNWQTTPHPGMGGMRIGSMPITNALSQWPKFAIGNFDAAADHEIVVATATATGRATLTIYDHQVVAGRTELVRRNALDLGQVCNGECAFAIATGNFDADAQSEIALAFRNNADQIELRVFDTPLVNGNATIRPLGAPQSRPSMCSGQPARCSPSLAAANLVHGATDEIILTQPGVSSNVLVYAIAVRNNALVTIASTTLYRNPPELAHLPVPEAQALAGLFSDRGNTFHVAIAHPLRLEQPIEAGPSGYRMGYSVLDIADIGANDIGESIGAFFDIDRDELHGDVGIRSQYASPLYTRQQFGNQLIEARTENSVSSPGVDRHFISQTIGSIDGVSGQLVAGNFWGSALDEFVTLPVPIATAPIVINTAAANGNQVMPLYRQGASPWFTLQTTAPNARIQSAAWSGAIPNCDLFLDYRDSDGAWKTSTQSVRQGVGFHGLLAFNGMKATGQLRGYLVNCRDVPSSLQLRLDWTR